MEKHNRYRPSIACFLLFTVLNLASVFFAPQLLIALGHGEKKSASVEKQPEKQQPAPDQQSADDLRPSRDGEPTQEKPEVKTYSTMRDIIDFVYRNGTHYNDVSAKYRTGSPDPHVLVIPAYIEQHLVSDHETGLRELAAYLKEGAENEYHIVKRIHDWIVLNIYYDADVMHGVGTGSILVGDILKERRTVCAGFSRLFRYLAFYAGIDSDTARGKSKTWLDERHAWNVVTINDTTYVIDTTHDGFLTYENRSFQAPGEYSDRALFLRPEAKLLTEQPEEEHQYIDPPVPEWEAFAGATQTMTGLQIGVDIEARPPSLYDVGGYRTTEYSGLERIVDTYRDNEGTPLVFTLRRRSQNINILALMYDKDGNRVRGRTAQYTDGTYVYCVFSGTPLNIKENPEVFTEYYQCIIAAKNMEAGTDWRTIYSCRLAVENDLPRTSPLLTDPLKPLLQPAAPYYGVSIGEITKLPGGTTVRCTVSHSADSSLYAQVTDLENNKQSGGITARRQKGPGSSEIVAKYTPNNETWLKVYAKRPETEKLYNNLVAVVRLPGSRPREQRTEKKEPAPNGPIQTIIAGPGECILTADTPQCLVQEDPNFRWVEAEGTAYPRRLWTYNSDTADKSTIHYRVKLPSPGMYEFHQLAAPEGTRNPQVHVTADGSKSTLWTRLEVMEGGWKKCGQKPLAIHDPAIDIVIGNGALRGGREIKMSFEALRILRAGDLEE